MPELPEVEIIRRGLAAELTGGIITGVKVEWAKSMPVLRTVIAGKVIGQEITAFSRRGKVLIIGLTSGYSLLIHLKMTGQLVLDLPGSKAVSQRVGGGHPTKSLAGNLPDSSTRVVFTFQSGAKLYFNDQRKFGWIRLIESRKVENEKFFQVMGPEPLDNWFEVREFSRRIKRTRRPVKAAILDQATVAGVGNIYADEALHLARIHPARPGLSLTQVEIKKLHRAIKEVMTASLELGGTSFASYVDTGGQKGDYLAHARVFKRQGQPCPECGTIIDKIKVAQRGTHICPNCQQL